MGGLISWLENNWFLMVQGLGIVGGLFFTALSIRQGTKSRRLGDLLTLNQHHRELWGEFRSNPVLSRITREEVDLLQCPVTHEETEFVNQVFIHFNTGWMMARSGSLLTIATLALDVSSFLKLPIPKSIWEHSEKSRDPKFVRFVQEAIFGCQS